MLRRSISPAVASAVLLVALARWASAAPISFGQVDTFQDGTTENWTNGSGSASVSVVNAGGPAGAGDGYLQIGSGSLGDRPRLLGFNDTQWTGDFVATGVKEIVMDLENFGTQTLSIRVAMRTSFGSSGTPGYASTIPFSLPADHAWHHAVFFIDAAHLTAINNPPPLATFLTSVGDFRLLDSASPSLQGDATSGEFGADNITAIPEPSSLALAAIGLSIFFACRRRAR